MKAQQAAYSVLGVDEEVSPSRGFRTHSSYSSFITLPPSPHFSYIELNRLRLLPSQSDSTRSAKSLRTIHQAL